MKRRQINLTSGSPGVCLLTSIARPQTVEKPDFSKEYQQSPRTNASTRTKFQRVT
jgi:hypothetical protein